MNGEDMILILIVEVLLINYFVGEVIFVEKLLVYVMVLMFSFCFEVGLVGCDICGLIWMY